MNIKAYDDLSGYAPPEDRWFAIDTDTYDGAPDGHSPVGMGPTPEAAIADLMERLEDAA